MKKYVIQYNAEINNWISLGGSEADCQFWPQRTVILYYWNAIILFHKVLSLNCLPCITKNYIKRGLKKYQQFHSLFRNHQQTEGHTGLLRRWTVSLLIKQQTFYLHKKNQTTVISNNSANKKSIECIILI